MRLIWVYFGLFATELRLIWAYLMSRYGVACQIVTNTTEILVTHITGTDAGKYTCHPCHAEPGLCMCTSWCVRSCACQHLDLKRATERLLCGAGNPLWLQLHRCHCCFLIRCRRYCHQHMNRPLCTTSCLLALVACVACLECHPLPLLLPCTRTCKAQIDALTDYACSRRLDPRPASECRPVGPCRSCNGR